MDSPIRFRWLGAAGVKLTAGGEVLLIDPFLTHPPLWRFFAGRVRPDQALLSRTVPRCGHILVSHAHYDHLLDVPQIARRTKAFVYGSTNTCLLAAACGVPEGQIREVGAGQSLQLGPFQVQVLEADHVRTPIDRLINGPLSPDLTPPLRLRDYRMDRCFSFRVQIDGVSLLHTPGRALPADLLFICTHAPHRVYSSSLPAARPKTVVPIHWDDFLRPLHRPIRTLPSPAGRDLRRFRGLVRKSVPEATLLVPEIMRPYSLRDLV